jgi:hypothetical protein
VNNTSEKHLKDITYYGDLYDRHTVERCRRLVHLHSQPMKHPPLIMGKKPSQRMIEVVSSMALDWSLMFEKGDRYIHKEEMIRDWMAKDEAKDRLYESAKPPAEVRCLKCRGIMNLLDKYLWSGGLNEPDRVLFMFDCPNGCVPRRAFYDNGEEWKSKPDLCLKCGKNLKVEDKTTEAKFITHYKCLSCGYAKTDELKRTANRKEKPDPDFEADRAKFCLSKEEGEKWRLELVNLEQMGKLVDEWKERDKNKVLYDKVAKIKKLTVIELEKLLAPALEKESYIHLQLANPEIDKNVIIPFTVQDSKTGRESRTNEYDLKRILKKILEDTNWRLMTDGVNYRLGVLAGRLKGYESEEDLLKLVQAK